MRPDERQHAILRRLAERGPASVSDLVAELDASEITIRRDLAVLAGRGLLRRTRGGAAPVPNGTAEFVFEQSRQLAHLPAKRAIGRAAAARIAPGTSLTLDTGTTTLEVARHLPASANLRVLTSSLVIASLLHAREDIELILLGGAVRKGSPDLYGPLTEWNLSNFRVDLAIIGADAVGPDGLFTTDQRIAQVSRAMIKSAHVVWLVADASKFGARALVRFATWDRITRVVTDTTLGGQERRWFRRLNVELDMVKPECREVGHG